MAVNIHQQVNHRDWESFQASGGTQRCQVTDASHGEHTRLLLLDMAKHAVPLSNHNTRTVQGEAVHVPLLWKSSLS